MRSARRWIGALPVLSLADQARDLSQRGVLADAGGAEPTSRPPTLTVAPTTSSPGPTSTGATDSPGQQRLVESARSRPRRTPSVATFSPGRTTNDHRRRGPATPNPALPPRPRRERRRSLAPSPSRARAPPGRAWRAPRSSARRGQVVDDRRETSSRSGRRRRRVGDELERHRHPPARRRRGRAGRRDRPAQAASGRARIKRCPSSGAPWRRFFSQPPGGRASRPRTRRRCSASVSHCQSRTAAARSSPAGRPAARVRGEDQPPAQVCAGVASPRRRSGRPAPGSAGSEAV